jgi:hypothetical protein
MREFWRSVAPISSTSTENCVVELVWAHLYTGVHLDKTELFLNLVAPGFRLRGLGFAKTKKLGVEFLQGATKTRRLKAHATGFRKLIK